MALLALLLSALAAAIALRGGMPNPGWLAVRNALAICVPVAVGSTHGERGRTRDSGACWCWPASSGSSSRSRARSEPLAYSIGRVAGWLSEIGIAYLVLAFPTGRLPGRAERRLALAAALLVGVLYVPTALLVESYPSSAPFTTCVAACPENAFNVVQATPAWVSDVVLPLRETLVILLMVAILWRLAHRTRGGRRLSCGGRSRPCSAWRCSVCSCWPPPSSCAAPTRSTTGPSAG